MAFGQIIVVDDSDADLLYAQVVLEASGIARQVLTFETGPDALAFLQRPEGQGVDLILLDINMPEMSGFEFLDAWQGCRAQSPASPARAATVMLTSSPDPADRARALAYPCVKGYLIKPIDLPTAQGLAALAGPDPG